MSEEIHASETIREYQEEWKREVFVETGTAQASTLKLVVADDLFREYHSIELDLDFWNQAKNLFDLCENVTIHHGESDKVLQTLLPQIDAPCLFWLDAHWVGGELDVMGSHGETPVMQELVEIFRSPHSHVILIDDARLFGAEGNYPTLNTVEETARGEDYDFVVHEDIIRLTREDT